MKINTLIILFFCFTKVFSQNEDLVETREYWTNGNLKVVAYSDGKYKQGIWQYYDSLGILTQEDKYINGNKYYLNLWLNNIQVIKNGNGQLSEYYYNGNLKATGQIKEGKKYGKWVEYYINGERQNEFEYVEWPVNFNNEIRFSLKLNISFDTSGSIIGRDGTGIIFLTNYNGYISEKVFYTNNTKDSVFTFFENGNIQSIKVTNNIYDLDLIKATFYQDGIKEYEEIVVGDTVLRAKYYPNGQLKETKEMTTLSDLTIEYNYNGVKTKVIICTKQYLTNGGEDYVNYDCKEKPSTIEQDK